MAKAQIQLVCAADERFAMPLAVTIISAAAKCSHPIRAFVLNTDLSNKSKRCIETTCARSLNPPEIEWVTADRDYLRNQPVGLPHLSQATYLRLGIGRMLPSDVHRTIYLDSDVLVIGDLAQLWNTKLDGAVLGAVRDFMTPTAGQPNALEYCLQQTGIPRDEPIFNAGVLLIDLDAYRLLNIEAECLAFLQRWSQDIQSADQDALNAVLYGRVKLLGFEWNLQTSSWESFKKHWSITSAEHQTIGDVEPLILHFSGQHKPWNSGLRSCYAQTYLRSVNHSGWYSTAGFRMWQAKRFAACVQTAAVNQYATFKSKKRIATARLHSVR